MSSDEVNSIGDTTESLQVAEIIRTTYFNMTARSDLPESKKLFQLTASADNDLPVIMYKPDNVRSIEWIKYNKKKVTDTLDALQYVTIIPLTQFLELTQNLNTDETNVDTFELNGNRFYFKNDIAPCFCTVVDDVNIVFDSFDNAVDTTLQESKTMAYGLTYPVFLMEDTFIPELDDQQFPLLLNEAKSLAFYELRQTPHEKAEQESKRQWRTLQRTKSLVKPSAFEQLPNFGRRSNTFGRPRWMRER